MMTLQKAGKHIDWNIKKNISADVFSDLPEQKLDYIGNRLN